MAKIELIGTIHLITLHTPASTEQKKRPSCVDNSEKPLQGLVTLMRNEAKQNSTLQWNHLIVYEPLKLVDEYGIE